MENPLRSPGGERSGEALLEQLGADGDCEHLVATLGAQEEAVLATKRRPFPREVAIDVLPFLLGEAFEPAVGLLGDVVEDGDLPFFPRGFWDEDLIDDLEPQGAHVVAQLTLSSQRV